MEDQGKLLLNEREAAQLLSMSAHFLRRDRISTSSVGIPFVRIGSAVRYRRVDLEEWIERHMQVQEPVQVHQLHPPTIVPVEASVKRGRGRPRKQAPEPCNAFLPAMAGAGVAKRTVEV